MGDLFSFLGGVLNHWVELMSGGIITVMVALIERHKTKNISWRWYIRLIVLFVFTACFLAWRDGHKELGEAKKELNETKQALERVKNDKKPKFHIHCEYATAGVVGNPPRPCLTLYVYVRNTGAPSTASGWELKIYRPGLPPLVGTPIFLAGDTVVRLGTEPPIKIKPSESLVNKVGTHLVQTNDAKSGILNFALDGTVDYSYPALFPPGTYFELSYYDATGERYTEKMFPKGPTDKHLMMPGMEVEPAITPEVKQH
jgi:hypothetical protein